MVPEKKAAFATFAYSRPVDNFDWIKVNIRSFRKFFPEEELIVVDNNSYEPMTSFLEENKATIIVGGELSHGHSIDLAVAKARELGYRYLVLLEQDMLIRGTEWFSAMYEEIQSGFYVVGWEGYIKSIAAADTPEDARITHVSPAIWDLENIPNSFTIQRKTLNELSSKEWIRFFKSKEFQNIYNTQEVDLVTGWSKEKCQEWLRLWWDAGTKNAFIAKTEDKMSCVPVDKSIIHFWYSRVRSPLDLIKGSSKIIEGRLDSATYAEEILELLKEP